MMDSNPYKSPVNSCEAQTKPHRSLARRAIDVFAIVFASLPLLLRGVLEITERASGGQTLGFIEQNGLVGFAMIFMVALVSLWLASLVINIVGVSQIRASSIVGVLLNIASLVAMA